MEQQLGFCTTSDGVSIAYATIGEGPPLVYAAGWPGHLALEMEKQHSRELLEDLAQGVTLIRYDLRGSGLSDRNVNGEDVSFDKWLLDLEAVVDHLQLDSFPLMSLGFLAGPISIAYAARHPERVSHLILSDAYARGEELTTPERGKAMVDYISLYGFPLGVDDTTTPEEFQKFQEVSHIQREAASLEIQGAVARTMIEVDVAEHVPRVTMPALVMHGKDDTVVPFHLGRNLAAALPQARFVPFDEPVSAPWRRQAALLSEIRRFLGIEVEARPRLQPAPPADVYTVLFTDMQSSTAVTQRLGDAEAQDVRRAHDRIVRDALRAHNGNEIKHTGDGIMASFSSASGALSCAIAIQRAIAEHGETNPDTPLAVYIGLNAGEPVAEDRDLFGTAVQLARRLCDQAAPGQILASNVVRELAAGKSFLFSDLGETIVRGFEDPVRIYEVSWQERG